MENQRGQVTILIGIIFQFVFIFFAMVINVGLLINDKINLQNSVDIAAYYGAMKQAQVMNAMAHVNYQTRQLWKLLNWRLWALANIGRNPKYLAHHSNMNAYIAQMSGLPDERDPQMAAPNYPVICVRTPFWTEEHRATTTQNVCKNANFTVPNLKPLQLSGAALLPMFAFLRIFENQSYKNLETFSQDCDAGAERNLYYAYLMVASYKSTVTNRRLAMRRLERLLVQSPQDFLDLSGSPVSATVRKVLQRNLTLANSQSLTEFKFFNSLGGNPFLVPVDLRLNLAYVDIYSPSGGACKGETKLFNKMDAGNYPFKGSSRQLFESIAELLHADLNKNTYAQSAQDFFNEPDATTVKDPMRSLVGFEKNPWIAAYVRVQAATKPKMLFSPIGKSLVELKAEAYAMPFGGRMGPWYSKRWNRTDEWSSMNSAKSMRIDPLLPPRVGDNLDNQNLNPIDFAPNYSRYPGDKIGMESPLAKIQGFSALVGSNPAQGFAKLMGQDDYGILYNSILQSSSGSGPMAIDPIVGKGAPVNQLSPIRKAELAAVAPDLFDSVYYSIQDAFGDDTEEYHPGFFSSPAHCPIGCEDLGNKVPHQNGLFGISVGGRDEDSAQRSQIALAKQDAQTTKSFWKLTSPNDLRTSWAQAQASSYNPESDAERVIGQPPNPSSPATMGAGRSGYSVKIISSKYLGTEFKNLGGDGISGLIKNPPQ